MKPGDVVLSWSSPAAPPAFPRPSGGEARLPYDLLDAEIEEAPRRAVLLRGRRGEEEKEWRLATGEWGLQTRPVLPAGLEALYAEGKARLDAGDPAAAGERWRAAAELAKASGEDVLAAWLLDRLAKALAEAEKWPEADAVYGQALGLLAQEPEPLATVQLLWSWGKAFDRRGAWDEAVERFQKALELARKRAPKSLTEALVLNSLGIVAGRREDYPTADKLLRQALAIREELAPGTSEVMGSLNNLGILARRRGDLEAAEEVLKHGEEIQRRLAPLSDTRALFLQNLGNVVRDRADLKEAESYYRQALAIFETIAPDGGGVTDILGRLADVATQRGDLAAADALLQRSLAIQERRSHNAMESSSNLIYLGNLASRRGDQETAAAHYRRALALEEKISPQGAEVAVSLGSLGIVEGLLGDFAAARVHLRRSLAIKERLAPDSLDAAAGMERLGRAEVDADGDLAEAERLLRRALAIYDRQAPESLPAADILYALGEATARRGRLSEASALHRRALDLRSRLAPGSTGEAETLHALGLLARRAGRAGEEIRYLCQAVDVLDRQRARVGDTLEAATAFESALGEHYHACLESLVRHGRPAEAFHVLERGRARSFLRLLGERDLRLRELAPELAAERRHADAEYDRIQGRLWHLSASRDGAEIEQLTSELRGLRARQEEILARIRRQAPRPAALQDPQPLDLAGARAVLDPGTVLLEYAVGRETSWLFVVEPADAPGAGLTVFRIAAGEKTLRQEVERFRRLLKRPGSERAALQDRARRLYGLLVRPAEGRISRGKRLLVSPDGPLSSLPFSTLRRGSRYLVEWRPIHSVLSATVYAELRPSRPARREPRPESLAAFGDPLYRRAPNADPQVREALRRGLSLTPLPSSRREVAAIASLYPGARTFLGAAATEERAKSLGPESRLIHFACHGLLDERFPLNSALALTLPEHPAEGEDNGLLQAWEIFEGVRLDADLVTLSACDTALGREMGGEGLVGLTRAFQYAGARSVLASLWEVADEPTARFMRGFYGHLHQGKSKDEALRAAQIDRIRERAHPFFWAAFELSGDWR
jgi:CHAT domain-containing protein/tetratricopeptide (TPR) repeat protein